MTRRRLFAYHTIGLSAFSGMLMLVAPPLAAEAVGFSVVYLAVMVVALTIGWGLGFRNIWPRLIGMVFMAWFCMGLFTAMGSPGIGVVAMVLAVFTYWPRRMWVHSATTSNGT